MLNKIKEQANTSKQIGEGVGFERIRRVTGYLSGDVRRFNNAKRCEEIDRVKHSEINEILTLKDIATSQQEDYEI